MTDLSHLQIYEQPLNERMRSLLRLEHLFMRIDHQVGESDPWSSRGALEGLIEVLSLLSRAEIKSELIKELERHGQTLEALERNPRVDNALLADVLEQVRTVLGALRTTEASFGHELRTNELLNTVRQRSAIPAGTCDFDLPLLHFWLDKPAAERHADLSRWASAFDLVREAVGLCLSLVRRSAAATDETAPGGFFQMTLDGAVPCQLVRVGVAHDCGCFTEISAGRHRFTIRFMEQRSADERPVQTERDVEFQLLCCTI